MKSDRSALPLVADLNPNAQNITELALESRKIGIDHLCTATLASGRCVRSGTGPLLVAPGALFGLPNRKPLGHDLARQRFGILGRRNGPRMPHTNFASH